MREVGAQCVRHRRALLIFLFRWIRAPTFALYLGVYSVLALIARTASPGKRCLERDLEVLRGSWPDASQDFQLNAATDIHLCLTSFLFTDSLSHFSTTSFHHVSMIVIFLIRSE